MKTPFFSVIIPTLNEESCMPVILGAIAKQSFRDFELLVVDGKSVDKTREIFDTYKALMPQARFIVSEKRNVGFQRNKGAAEAKGKYLIFFDADVFMSPTYFEEIHVQILKKKLVFMTNWMKADSDNPIDQFMVTVGNLGWELAKEVRQPFLSGFNIVILNSVFQKLEGFRDDVKIAEDRDLAMRAQAKGIELVILPEPKLVISLRRFRSEGTLKVLRKYAQAEIHMLFKGPVTSETFDYEMGGHVHKVKRKKINLTKLSFYLEKMEHLQKEITKLLSE